MRGKKVFGLIIIILTFSMLLSGVVAASYSYAGSSKSTYSYEQDVIHDAYRGSSTWYSSPNYNRYRSNNYYQHDSRHQRYHHNTQYRDSQYDTRYDYDRWYKYKYGTNYYRGPSYGVRNYRADNFDHHHPGHYRK